MDKLLSLMTCVLLFASQPSLAEEIVDHNKTLMDHGGGHLMDMGGGMVMGHNTDMLPGGCDRIAATKEITVHAGHKYAKPFPGRMYAFDVQEYQFEPCTKLTVTLVNEDHIRHQWMMHNLPKYLYPKGMFHLEVTGPGKISGTLILPSGDKTYLVHCDIAQHMEKGMKGQLKVGKGSGDLPSIPGVTPYVIQDAYDTTAPPIKTVSQAAPVGQGTKAIAKNGSFMSGVMVIGLAVGLLLAPLLAFKFKGMTATEVIAYVFGFLKEIIGYITALLASLARAIGSNAK